MIGTGIDSVCLQDFSKLLHFLPAQAIDNARLFRIILDELDSGLDVDSLKIVCESINKYKEENPDTAILIITHYSRILSLIHPDYVHEMIDGKIVKTGPFEFAKEIESNGYLRENEMSDNDARE